jgi:hypothetical protein
LQMLTSLQELDLQMSSSYMENCTGYSGEGGWKAVSAPRAKPFSVTVHVKGHLLGARCGHGTVREAPERERIDCSSTLP